jgi:hypothetical protein
MISSVKVNMHQNMNTKILLELLLELMVSWQPTIVLKKK